MNYGKAGSMPSVQTCSVAEYKFKQKPLLCASTPSLHLQWRGSHYQQTCGDNAVQHAVHPQHPATHQKKEQMKHILIIHPVKFLGLTPTCL